MRSLRAATEDCKIISFRESVVIMYFHFGTRAVLELTIWAIRFG